MAFFLPNATGLRPLVGKTSGNLGLKELPCFTFLNVDFFLGILSPLSPSFLSPSFAFLTRFSYCFDCGLESFLGGGGLHYPSANVEILNRLGLGGHVVITSEYFLIVFSLIPESLDVLLTLPSLSFSSVVTARFNAFSV